MYCGTIVRYGSVNPSIVRADNRWSRSESDVDGIRRNTPAGAGWIRLNLMNLIKQGRYIDIKRSVKKKVQIRHENTSPRFSRYARTRHSAALVIQGCRPVQEEERPQYISRNDTNSNRSELIIAGKKLINAYDLLAGFCRGAYTIQLKRRFAGLTTS